MTPRERWLALLEDTSVDRIPADYEATGEVTARLLDELDCDSEDALWRKLQIDKHQWVDAQWKLPHFPGDPQADVWGVRYRTVDYGRGTYHEPCFAPLAHVDQVADVHKHRWPRCEDFDYTAVTHAAEDEDGYYPVHATCCELTMWYGYLRGLEQSLEDLALNPDITDACLGQITDFYLEHSRRIFQAGRGRIDVMWISDDLGSQCGPIMSLATYRRFFLAKHIQPVSPTENIVAVYETIHELGKT